MSLVRVLSWDPLGQFQYDAVWFRFRHLSECVNMYKTYFQKISKAVVFLVKVGSRHLEMYIRGQSKKSETWAVHLLICWLFLLLYSNKMHKWWMKVRFLTCQMPVLSGRTSFDPFLKTWKSFTPKFPMKYGKNGQNFTTPENT